MLTNKQYNEAVKNYSRNIYRYVFKSLRDEEASNDIIQDCYLKLWQHKESIDHLKVKSWLFSTAHHRMLNYIKKSLRTESIETAIFHEPISQDHSNFDVKEIIEQSLDTLPQLQKTIILLRDLEGYNYQEIADILQLSESQVKVYLFRARQKIKTSLKDINILL